MKEISGSSVSQPLPQRNNGRSADEIIRKGKAFNSRQVTVVKNTESIKKSHLNKVLKAGERTLSGRLIASHENAINKETRKILRGPVFPLSGMRDWLAQSDGENMEEIQKALAEYNKTKDTNALKPATKIIHERVRGLMRRCCNEGDVILVNFNKSAHSALIVYDSAKGKPQYLSFGLPGYRKEGGDPNNLVKDMFKYKDTTLRTLSCSDSSIATELSVSVHDFFIAHG